MGRIPLPEPIDIVERLLRTHSPAGIVALCRRIAQRDSDGDWRKEYWPWQLEEVARLALAVEEWLSTHKAGS